MEDTITTSERQPLEAKRVSTLIRFLVYIPLLVLIVFAIPVEGVPFQFSKSLLVIFVFAALLALLAIRAFRKKECEVLYSPLLFSLWAIPLVYAISAIFSDSPSLSFLGYQLEVGSFGFMFVAVAITTTVAAVLNGNDVLRTLKVFGYAVGVVLVFQLVQVLFNAPIPITGLNDPIINLVGRWSDFGVFAGLIASLALLSFVVTSGNLVKKIILGASFVVSLFFVALTALPAVWVLFGFIALALLLAVGMQFMRERSSNHLWALVLPAVGVLVAALFLIFGGLSTNLQNSFGINTLDVRPSIQGTFGVLQQIYTEAPVLGTGPNTFAANWLLHRPDDVLLTAFWDVPFSFGASNFLSAFATGGVLTLLVLAVFTLVLLYTLIRSVLTKPDTGKGYIATLITALGVFYLLVSLYVLSLSQSLVLLFFIFLGLFIASIKETPFVRRRNFSLAAPRIRYAHSALIGLVLLILVFVVFTSARMYGAAMYNNGALAALAGGDVVEAQELAESALFLYEQDRYYRTAALVELSNMNEIVQNNQDVTDEVRATFQTSLSRAIEFTAQAIATDPHSFENWMTRAAVYANVVPLQIQGAFDTAVSVLEEARVRSPKSPVVDFRLAELYRSTGDTERARGHVEASLERKANYTPAILLLAQMELDEGNLDEAIESVRALVFFEPENPVLLYQLGILLLQDQNYEEATLAFEAALGRQPNFANAAFFLSQSYAFTDRLNEAAQIMRQVAERNPTNDVAQDFAAALEQGENPFASGEVASLEGDESVE